MQMLWPVIVVVTANTVYNICAKQTPENLNPFFSLIITYSIATVLSLILYFVTSPDKSFAGEFSKMNWASYVLGGSIVALEFGYLNVYRVGWKVSTASLVSNICLAVILFAVGLLFYKEEITLRKAVGALVCVAGLAMITV